MLGHFTHCIGAQKRPKLKNVEKLPKRNSPFFAHFIKIQMVGKKKEKNVLCEYTFEAYLLLLLSREQTSCSSCL